MTDFLITFLSFLPTGAHRATASATSRTREPGIQDGGREARDASATSRPDGQAAGGGAATDRAASGTDGPNAAGSPGAAGGAEEDLSVSTTCQSGGLRKWKPPCRFSLHSKDS